MSATDPDSPHSDILPSQARETSAPRDRSRSPRAAAASEQSTPDTQRYLTLSTAELAAWEEQDADVRAWALLLAIVRDFEREGSRYFHARPFLTRAYLVLEQWHISGTADPEAPATELYHEADP